MSIRIGYACLALAVPQTAMKSCRLSTLTQERLRSITADNLAALERLLRYNIQLGIQLFRISSDLIPFGSSPANDSSWQSAFEKEFDKLGALIAEHGLRVSMHPGQYTVLNSPDAGVVDRAILDLEYHNKLLDLLHTPASSKLILHLGGSYGDKPAAMERFVRNFQRLSEGVKRRLVLENDERSYTIEEVLTVAQKLSVPAVFDNLHHALNPPAASHSDAWWMDRCALTWQPHDGRQKVHYSQQSSQGKPGAHSKTIELRQFMQDMAPIKGRPIDVMLEVKDKNLSAIKCMLCLQPAPVLGALEREWARYKYAVLEHSQHHYQQIRALLKDKSAASAPAFYSLVDEALTLPITTGNAANAAMHVWGYFKKTASEKSKAEFDQLVHALMDKHLPPQRLKRWLHRQALACEVSYLLASYYFIDM